MPYLKWAENPMKRLYLPSFSSPGTLTVILKAVRAIPLQGGRFGWLCSIALKPQQGMVWLRGWKLVPSSSAAHEYSSVFCCKWIFIFWVSKDIQIYFVLSTDWCFLFFALCLADILDEATRKDLFTDAFCKVCSAVLQSESQRMSHYEVGP